MTYYSTLTHSKSSKYKLHLQNICRNDYTSRGMRTRCNPLQIRDYKPCHNRLSLHLLTKGGLLSLPPHKYWHSTRQGLPCNGWQMAGGPILALTKGIIYLCPDSALLTALCCQLCIKTKIVSFLCHHLEPLWRMEDQTKDYSQPSSQPPHIFVLRLHFDRPYICVVAYTYHFCCIYITFCGIPISKSCIYILFC